MKDRDILLRMVSGSLKQCIEAHGPITKNFTSSASNRLVNQIIGHIKNVIKQDVQKEIAEQFSKDFVVIERERVKQMERSIERNRQGLVYWKAKAQELEAMYDV